ncbi:MAG: MoaD/ThiS family protein [Planctomycetota bacterium]|nr:MAG: MoaD/ThiS family protein [Planctomycetota bacterium]
MPEIHFTPQLERFLSAPTRQVDAGTVRAALVAVFAANPALQGYILDDQGRLRQHVAVFVDGQPLLDRAGLSDPLAPTSRIFVMQALSGG